MVINMKKEKILKIIRSIGAIALFYCSYYIQLGIVFIAHLNRDELKSHPEQLVIITTISSLIISIILLIVYWKDLKKEWTTYKANLYKNIDTGLTCWAIGLIIMTVTNLILMYGLKSGGANNENLIQSYIKALPWVMGIDICLLAPFNEEIVYRKTIKDVFGNTKIFIFLSFLLFGMAHVSGMAKSLIDWLYIIPYGSLGAAFAIAYKKTDTVYTSMTFHMIHNLFVFLLSVATKL